MITLKHDATRRLDALFEEHLLPYVDEAKSIKVTGSGDPFGSRHFRYILSRLTDGEYPLRRIQLHTNGLLANARAWTDLRLYGNVDSVWVSVDAARTETYAILRRGGSFDELIPNLRFLGDLRQRDEIGSFRLDFVVQKQNYGEIGAFVDLAQSVGADGVYFLRLRNWGHFDVDAFRAIDVCAEDHPEHDLLLDQLTDPRLTQRGVVLGSMTTLMQKARAHGSVPKTHAERPLTMDVVLGGNRSSD